MKRGLANRLPNPKSPCFPGTFGSQFPKPVSGFGSRPPKNLKKEKRKTPEGLGVDATKPTGFWLLQKLNITIRFYSFRNPGNQTKHEK
jgi:hypothetical protein